MNTRLSPLKTPIAKERTAIEVYGRLFKTKEAAAKNTAWHWIYSKYGGMKNAYFPPIESVTKILDMQCDCAETNTDLEYGIQYLHDGCQIHDRHDGYFRRLHKRIVREILKSWEK